MFDPKPGKMAEVTVKNTRPKGEVFYHIPDTVTYVGMIEIPNKYVTSDKFQMSAGKDARCGFNSRVIPKSSIVALRYFDGSDATETTKTSNKSFMTTVSGSKGNTYTVSMVIINIT